MAPKRIDLPPLDVGGSVSPRDVARLDRKRKHSAGVIESADAASFRVDLSEDTSLMTVSLAEITGFGASGGLLQSDGSSWVRVDRISYANLPSGGGTWSNGGDLSFEGGAFAINGAAGTRRKLNFNTGGVLRWSLYVGESTETGANVGSGFNLRVYDDSGAELDASPVLHIDRAAGSPVEFGRGVKATGLVRITGPAGTNRELFFATDGVPRWRVEAGNLTESGGNAGSRFVVTAYNDAGAQIDSPILIERAASGLMTISRPLQLTGGDLTFTDDTYDIGKPGTTRPRDGFFSRNVSVGGGLLVTSSPRPLVVATWVGAANLARFGKFATGNAHFTENISFDGTDWNLDDTSLTGAVFSFGGTSVMRAREATAGSNPRTLIERFVIQQAGDVIFRSPSGTELVRVASDFRLEQNLIFPADSNYDIGANISSSRPRDGFFGRDVSVGRYFAANGKTPTAAPDYTITNPATRRSIDVVAITHAQLAEVVGTMVQDFINIGLYQ